ncbi:hypothetical protein CU097_006200 [Rhizopus azygosporus]|uniref:Uncharacterized protein n=1 Tax=Rhizopus azygosporus TaxID=86630 RepID=A0A367JGJ0_RHIAZ|nr:hypothetical protein CU097_006200 [Rhizopus azygosporus]
MAHKQENANISHDFDVEQQQNVTNNDGTSTTSYAFGSTGKKALDEAGKAQSSPRSAGETQKVDNKGPTGASWRRRRSH